MNHPADEIRAAARLLRDRAQAATPGPWRTHDTHLTHGGHTATILTGGDRDTALVAWLPTGSDEPWDEARNAWRTADWIALADPVVGLAMADLLDGYALDVETCPEDHPGIGLPGEPVNVDELVLALARAVLGDEAAAR